jgi:hypothetical protein
VVAEKTVEPDWRCPLPPWGGLQLRNGNGNRAWIQVDTVGDAQRIAAVWAAQRHAGREHRQ